MSKLRIAAALFITFIPARALAQTSAEYVAMAKQAWADLECAALASYADEESESKRTI
jgi:hypothetical protein